jgi:hypothetical protein
MIQCHFVPYFVTVPLTYFLSLLPQKLSPRQDFLRNHNINFGSTEVKVRNYN